MAQKNEKFLFRILNSITDPLAIYDRHYRINQVNQALVNLYELPEANVVGRYCYEVFHKRSSVCENCHVREVFRPGETRRREMNVTLPDGQQHYFVIHCYPLRDRHGQVVQAIEHARDVTEPRNLQHQLKVSEERYRTLVETAREGIFMVAAGTGGF